MVSDETQRLRILVVDDDRTFLRLLVKMVSSAGHYVSKAENGRDALVSILRDGPDLVICDWEMPDVDGLELCRMIRRAKLPRYVYLLLLTARSNSRDLVRGLEAGADDFITKPIDKTVLLARLQAAARVLVMERRLRSMSEHDPLTGLLNRRAFHDRFAEVWNHAFQYDRQLSCVMVDIDFFKRINDDHGHAAGDATLKAVALHLEGLRRSSDVLCRYGGEEFCLLLPETNEVEASHWAEQFRRAVSEVTIPVGALSLQLTVSCGVAELREDTTSPDRLIQLADEALDFAKQTGRNRVIRFASLQEPLPELSGQGRQAGPLEKVSARDVMSAVVICPHYQDTVRDVADLFLQLRTNSAPVIGDSGEVLGMVTESDLMIRTALGKGWDEPIQDLIRTDVVCFEEHAPAKDVYQFLSRVSVPRLVVVDQGRPTGVISRGTLLRWFRNWLVTHEEADEGLGGMDSPDEHAHRKQSIVKTAEAMVRHAAEIPRRLADNDEEFIPCVVGEATRLQDLVNDLLGQCQQDFRPR